MADCMADDVERFLEYAYANSRMLHKSFAASLDRAVIMLGKGSGMHTGILRAKNMVACGEDISRALTSQILAGRIRPREKLRYVHLLSYMEGRDFGAAITDVHREIIAERNTRARIAYGSMQKYFTENMLFGTILPSMAMFGFVGYSLIDYSNLVMFLFLFALLVAMPIIYATLQNRLRSLDV